MATSKPTQDIADWGSTGTIADSIPTAEVEQGQEAGRPVPAAWINLFGAWLDFFRAGGGQVYINGASFLYGGNVTVFDVRTVTSVQLDNSSGSTENADLISSPIATPGTVTSVDIQVTATGGSVDIQPEIYWSDGAGGRLQALFESKAVSGSSVVNFAFESVGSDSDDIGGPWSLVIRTQIDNGETLTVGNVFVNLS